MTLKLRRGEATRIVECSAVDVIPLPGVEGVVHVLATLPDGGSHSFYVVRPGDPEGRVEAGHGDALYHVAYVENARGSTTQVVRP